MDGTGKESELKVEEVKDRLLSIFQNDGSVGKLKAHLRRRFLLKLRSIRGNIPNNKENDTNNVTHDSSHQGGGAGTSRVAWGIPGEEDGPSLKLPSVTVDILRSRYQAPTLFQRALNGLVAEYLKSSGYDFTYSIFVPESGSENLFMTEDEIAATLRLEPLKAERESLFPLVETTGTEEGGGARGEMAAVFQSSLLGRMLGASCIAAKARYKLKEANTEIDGGEGKVSSPDGRDPMVGALTTRPPDPLELGSENLEDGEDTFSRTLSRRL